MMIATIPIVWPIVQHLGYDGIWFGIFLVLMCELALITPPVGMNLYIVQSVRGRGSIETVNMQAVLADGSRRGAPRPGVLLADPVVTSINDLPAPDRTQFLLDMVTLGDAILRVSGAYRINYEILGNSEPELHAHVFPRFMTEPEDQRRKPAWFYDWPNAVRFSPAAHGHLVEALRAALSSSPGARA